MQKHVAKNPYPKRLARALLFAALSALLAACGVGNSFTGGGVPIGRAVIIGRAVSAIAPNAPIASARVYLSISTNTRTGMTLTATTDLTGRFTFPDIPVESAPTSVRVAIEPTSNAYLAQQIFFKLDKGNTANLIVTLAPAAIDPTQVSSVSLSPTPNIFPTLTGQVNAQALDSQGTPLQITPSLLFIGDFSAVQPNGTFVSVQEQIGTVEVFWYNNLQASSTVSIQNNTNGSPPQPP